MKKDDTVTSLTGDSSSRWKGSLLSLPMRKEPPGIATMEMDADVPGTVSVKSLNPSTSAAEEYISPEPVSTLPTIFSCL